MKNKNLREARRKKNDEFYTLLPDIENELKWYKDHFKDKVVYCNCDDPESSNFVKFFQAKFEDYGLKKLIVSHYKENLVIVDTLIMDAPDNIYKSSVWGDGSYDSEDALKLLEEADIVVTNPPFSLFREYIATLMRYKKDFLIIGSMNALTYKEIFPFIKQNKLWLGVSPRSMTFLLPDGNTKQVNACWFTNLEHHKRNTPILLYKQYSPEEYVHYDNYNAIEVSKVKDIPVSYEGVMGVPITFLEKYCPFQFEIIGTQRWFYDTSLGITNGKTLINGKETYDRIFIKHVNGVVSNED